MKMLSLRASEETLKEVERLAKIGKIDKSLVLREALNKGLEKVKLETAIKMFSEGKLSVSEAGNTAGLSVGEIMQELRQKGLGSRITQEELEGTLEEALNILK